MSTEAATATEPVKAANPGASMSTWMSGLGTLNEPAPASTLEPSKAEPAQPGPPPKTEPVVAESKTEPKVDDGEEKWPRSSKDWSEFKAARKAKEDALVKERDGVRTELESVRKEIETLKKSGPSPELDSLKKERDELSEKLRLVAVEKHPKFQTYFDNKVNAQLDLAKSIVGEDRADRIVKALKLPEGQYRDEQLESIIGELGTVGQTRIGGVINSLAQINQERETELANAQRDYQKLESQKQQQETELVANRRKQVENVFNGELAKAQEMSKGLFLFQPKDGDEGWNAGVKQRIEMAKQLILGQNKPEDLAQAALCAVSMPHILSMGAAIQKENETLKNQIKELSSASPRVAQGDVKAVDGENIPIQHKSGASPFEASAAWTKNLMSARQ